MDDTRIERLRAYMQLNNLSQADIARMFGISQSMMSGWLKGSYPNPESVNAKVDELLEKEEKRQEIQSVSHIEFAKTGISNTIWFVLEYCQAQKSPGCLYGDAGIGKTFTTQQWSKGKSDVIVITAAPAIRSMKAFLKRLARRLDVSTTGNLDDVYCNIEEKLDISDKTIIIDEAQHLSYSTTENIRILGDTTKTSIVFIGNELVYSRLLGKQEAEFAQAFSRMYMKRHFKKEGITKCTDEQLQRVVKVLGLLKGKEKLQNNRMTDSQMHYIEGLAKTLGWAEEPERLAGFVERTTKVDKTQWLTKAQACKVIEGLKKMADRLKAVKPEGDSHG